MGDGALSGRDAVRGILAASGLACLLCYRARVLDAACLGDSRAEAAQSQGLRLL